MAEQLAQSADEQKMIDRSSPRPRRHVSKDVWVLLGVILLALGWFVRLSRLAMDQHAAVEAIRKSGGHLYYDWEWSDGRPVPGARAPWLSELMNRSPSAPDYSANIVCVSFAATQGSDVEMTIVGQLIALEDLNLSGTNLTDERTVHFQSLTHLRRLDLSDCGKNITDAGLISLGGLLQLESLNLDDTDVTDAGLPSLSGLVRLQSLSLRNTRTSNAGINSFRTQRPEVKIIR